MGKCAIAIFVAAGEAQNYGMAASALAAAVVAAILRCELCAAKSMSHKLPRKMGILIFLLVCRVLEGLKTEKSTLMGPVVAALVGDLVGALVGPLVVPLVGRGSLSLSTAFWKHNYLNSLKNP